MSVKMDGGVCPCCGRAEPMTLEQAAQAAIGQGLWNRMKRNQWGSIEDVMALPPERFAELPGIGNVGLRVLIGVRVLYHAAKKGD